jgi:3-phenylpropionate/trans-cinnamate dioxygenase ferredoxin reductase subunit
VCYLRTLADARAIRARLEPGAPLVVVGAGFIGAEVAASARGVGCEVTMLEACAVPLLGALGSRIGRLYADVHRRHGVDVRTGVSVCAVERDADLWRVCTAEGVAFPAAVVVAGVGMEPDIAVAAAAGIPCDNGIVVDEHCRTAIPDIYAVGDVANHPNALAGRRIRVEHWQHAQNQAAVAARSMLGRDAAFAEVPWFWSDQYDLNLQVTGFPAAGERIVARGDVESSSFSAFYVGADGRLVGALGVNRPLDVRAARRLIGSRATVPDELLADESLDLSRAALPAA